MSTQPNDDDFYRKIEKKHKFSIPEDYRKMRKRGWMTLHGPASEEKFFESGENYLLMSDMEWYSPKEISETEFPDFTKPCLSNLVPFAFTGGGDWWCWQTNHQTKKWGTRVLLCLRHGVADIYAPNFAAALFRQTLELANRSGHWSLKGRRATPEDKQRIADISCHLRRYVADLALIFPAEWCAVLADLASRKAVWWEQTVPNGRVFDCYSVLDDQERKQIERFIGHCRKGENYSVVLTVLPKFSLLPESADEARAFTADTAQGVGCPAG